MNKRLEARALKVALVKSSHMKDSDKARYLFTAGKIFGLEESMRTSENFWKARK